MQAPPAQTSCVHALASGVQAPDARGTHAVPFHPWHSGHRAHTPSRQGPVVHVPQSEHPDGDAPHTLVPQSSDRETLAWEQTPPTQTSCVHASLSGVLHASPSVTGTHALPFQY